MNRRRMVVLAVVAVGVLAAGLWLTMACGQRAAEPTPSATPTNVPFNVEDPATLCAPEEGDYMTQQPTEEQVEAVYDMLWDKLNRLPEGSSFATGTLLDEHLNSTDKRGIIVYLRGRKPDQSALPEEDRIPSCVDGVPIQFIENLEIKFLGG